MLFNIAELCVLSDVESVDAVMLAELSAAIVDSAAGNDRDIAVLSDIEIVVHKVGKTGLTDNDRDVDTFPFSARFDIYFDALFIILRYDLDVVCGISACRLAVGSDIVSTDRKRIEIGNFL